MIWVKPGCCTGKDHDRAVKSKETERKQHWEAVYGSKPAHQTSWHQSHPELSLSMIENSGISRDAELIDVGCGASILLDYLLKLGFRHITVLDISRAALEQAQERLGDHSLSVQWIESDVTQYVPGQRFELWHDRAAFHFLTADSERRRYVDVLHKALAPGGQAIISTFAPGGPPRCSGLDVIRYDAEKLALELGAEFILEEQREEIHTTPLDRKQPFNYFRFRRTLPVFQG